MDTNHHRIYEHARCYDVAFGFRDVAAECDTLAALAARHTGRPVTRMLELAAGPARHAREFARRGAAATALDASPAMLDYALERAAHHGVPLQALCADMCDFRLPQRVDLAVLLMDSASYLLDNDAVLRHLGCVAEALGDDGLYVLEMSHPRDAFGVGASANTQWTSEDDGLRVDMRWGAAGDVFDPVTQVEDVTVTMDWSAPAAAGSWSSARGSAAARPTSSMRWCAPAAASTSSRSSVRWRHLSRSATTPPRGAWCRCCANGRRLDRETLAPSMS